jgi:hypothetical protein
MLPLKGADFLRRAEAVQFIKNLKDKGQRELQKRPELPTPKDHMPKPKDDANPPAKVREVKNKMEEVVSQKYPGYVVTGTEENTSRNHREGWARPGDLTQYNDLTVTFEGKSEGYPLTVIYWTWIGTPDQRSRVRS